MKNCNPKIKAKEYDETKKKGPNIDHDENEQEIQDKVHERESHESIQIINFQTFVELKEKKSVVR